MYHPTTRMLTILELLQVHLLDVAADRALAERQRHPGLELRDHPRLHLGVLV